VHHVTHFHNSIDLTNQVGTILVHFHFWPQTWATFKDEIEQDKIVTCHKIAASRNQCGWQEVKQTFPAVFPCALKCIICLYFWKVPLSIPIEKTIHVIVKMHRILIGASFTERRPNNLSISRENGFSNHFLISIQNSVAFTCSSTGSTLLPYSTNRF